MITSSTPVTCEGLSVALGTTPVLRDIGLTLTSGETVALLGGNGSGKTTLLRALLGLVPLAAGRAELFGTPVGAFREWWRVGYVPQRGRLRVASATVEEVVASGRLARRRWFRPAGQDDRAATARALELVNLDHLAHRPVAQLSGGQRQRALIARALASRPDLIVLDEPLAGLDLDTQAGLAAVLGRLKAAGTSILVVLHELGPMAPLLDDAI
ncbi:MAG: metal ABC transporter ATP-binding protein, partial [Actinomycetia bacterium]|nr:metal ABC transporter ATP-binding protein [Actinomycetes bacterium]